MRSIRLSLIVCFLVLLVLSLATASGLAYREARKSLDEKKNTSRQNLMKKYDERSRVARKHVDDQILADARNLASLVRVQIQNPSWKKVAVQSLGLSSAPLHPLGHLIAPFWLSQGTFGGMNFMVTGMSPSIQFRDLRIASVSEGQLAKHFQIHASRGDSWEAWASPSLGNERFPFDPDEFSSEQLVDWRFDDFRMKNGEELRVVRLKVSRFPVFYKSYWFPKMKGGPGKKGRSGKFGRPPSPRPQYSGPAIVVQAAAGTKELNALLGKYGRDMHGELAVLDENSERQLAALRDRLIFINIATLVVAIIGGCLVVQWGLTPVRRLSQAVSEVSERDFKLPVKTEELPRELRPISEQMRQTLDMLHRAFEREKQAAADISHELRTPVAAMMTTLDVALRKPRSAEEYKEILEECRQSGQQMTQLVERMLALARLDAGADHLRPKEVDVSKLADQCASMVQPLVNARGLTLCVERNGPVMIKTDPDKIREVLTNLLHNAIEYNKPNGQINMSVARDNGSILMQVSDTGIGIPEESKEHIFERFYRQDASRHAESLHAGIGLALVKGYVELMHGNLTLESTVGEGSTFRIELPVGENAHE